MSAGSNESSEAEEFLYFTIRVRRVAKARSDGAIRGVIECLDIPEKHAFESGEELLRIVARHGDRRAANMALSTAAHKSHDPKPDLRSDNGR